MPNSFTTFIRSQYNNFSQWEELKNDYTYTNMLNKRKIIKMDEDKRSLPFEGEPNTITDLVDNEAVKQRRIYGKNGKAIKDIDTHNHNKPKYHIMGAHKHEYDYTQRNPHGKAEYLTERELRQNRDIIKKGVNYNANKSKET